MWQKILLYINHSISLKSLFSQCNSITFQHGIFLIPLHSHRDDVSLNNKRKKRKKRKKSRKTDYLPNDDNEATKLKEVKNNKKIRSPVFWKLYCIWQKKFRNLLHCSVQFKSETESKIFSQQDNFQHFSDTKFWLL